MSGILNTVQSDSGTLGTGQEAAKAYCRINGAGVLHPDSLNIASITDTDTGIRHVVFDTDFSNTNYISIASGSESGSTTNGIHNSFDSFLVGSVRLMINWHTSSGANLLDSATSNVFFGDL
tara:strand:- start:214 stop:576 length:363 start_codon:yes stop_codon:yes gene_type:complete